MDKSDLSGEHAEALQRRLRQALALSGQRQADISRACDISPAAVSLWFAADPKKRTVPTPANLLVVAKETSVPYQWLAFGEGAEPPGLAELEAKGKVRRIRTGTALDDFTRAPRPRTREFLARFRGALLSSHPALVQHVDQEVEALSARDVLPEEFRRAGDDEIDWKEFAAGARHHYDYISSRLAIQVTGLMPGSSVSGRAAVNSILLQFGALADADERARIKREALLVLVPQEAEDARDLTVRERTALALLHRELVAWPVRLVMLSKPEELAEIVARVERGQSLVLSLEARAATT